METDPTADAVPLGAPCPWGEEVPLQVQVNQLREMLSQLSKGRTPTLECREALAADTRQARRAVEGLSREATAAHIPVFVFPSTIRSSTDLCTYYRPLDRFVVVYWI